MIKSSGSFSLSENRTLYVKSIKIKVVTIRDRKLLYKAAGVTISIEWRLEIEEPKRSTQINYPRSF